MEPFSALTLVLFYPGIIYLVVGVFGSIAGQCGDLTASMIKRKAKIKDFGTILPGHGGILDRFDSILFIIPLILYFCQINHWHRVGENLNLYTILITLLILCVLVIVHELGHFMVAKKTGIFVEEFAIGMGPKLFARQGKETLFTISGFSGGRLLQNAG